MEYRPLGRSGVSVSQLCLGAMMFGAFGNPDHDASIRIIHTALDAGINFIDTADGYSASESEAILGKAPAGGRRERVVLAVKFGVPFGEDSNLNHRGASRRWIMQAVDGSQIVEAQWTAQRRGYEHFGAEQPPYSLLTRAIEYDVLPTCLRHGMGVLTYSPLAGGWLSGKYRKGQPVSGPGSVARAQRPGVYDASNPANAAKLEAADDLGALAEEAGLTLIQMAIAFVTRHPAVTSAIIGPRTMEHLDSYLAAPALNAALS
jgi:aryl-alcohol dehydrogenase-like predicted oxidoreductase